MTIRAKYAGRCRKCGGGICVGDEIDWERGEGASHVECPATTPGVKLGGQLFEPCERCGTEPSYMQPGGHLCKRCAQDDHPKLDAARVPYYSEEPDGAR